MSEPEPDAPPRWAGWFTAATLVVAAVALVATVWVVGPFKIIDHLATIGAWFALIVALELLLTTIDGVALSGFLGRGGRRPGYFRVIRAHVAGRAVNAVTPLASLGEATKITMLMDDTGTSRAVAAVVRYNLASLGVNLLCIAIGAPICALSLDLPPWLDTLLFTGSAGAVTLLICGALLVKRGMLSSVAGALARIRIVPRKRLDKWKKRLGEIDEQLRSGSDDAKVPSWAPAGWVALSRMVSLGTTWVALAAAGYMAGPGLIGALATAGTLIGSVSTLVPLGVGIGEAGNAALFAALGAPASLGVTAVLARRVTLLLYAGVGLVLLAAGDSVRRVKSARGTRTPRPVAG